MAHEGTQLILASGSSRRKNLFRYLGLKFRIIPSNFDERSVPLSKPKKYVKTLACEKANSIGKNIKTGVVIAADTVVVLGGKILNKPVNKKEAHAMLSELSGSTIEVVTGLCVIDVAKGHYKMASVTTKVSFIKLSDELIKRYLRVGNVLTKSGAWSIEGDGAAFVESVKGSYTNLFGIPVQTLFKIFRELSIIVS